MTVQELLRIPALKDLKIIGGQTGISNRVSTVSVMDAPDIYNWMKGGEFLITTAYSIKGDAQYLSVLLKKLKSANVAAFGVKFSRFWDEIPRSAIDTADRLGIPLISIPDKFAFTDIINPVLYEIVNQQTVELLQKDQMHKAFLDVVLKSNDARSILNLLSNLVQRNVVYGEFYFNRVISNVGGNEFGEMIFPGGNVRKSNPLKSKYVTYLVTNGQIQYGRLFVQLDQSNESVLPIYQTAIEYAGILLALNTQSSISRSQIEERYRNEFFSDLIHKNINSRQELDTRSKLYGWTFSSGGIILIVDVNNVKKQYVHQDDCYIGLNMEELVDRITDIAQCLLSEIFGEVRHYKQSDFIIYLISIEKDKHDEIESRLRTLFPRMQEQIQAKTPASITVGVGTYQEDILNIHKSYEDARFMIQLAHEMDLKNNVFFYEHMSTFRLLAAINDADVKEEFIQKYLYPLIRYDACHGSNLLKTIQETVWNGWNLKAAADALFIHYNSMKYRMGKINELLGIDLKEHENQLNVELAVNLYLMTKKDRNNWEIFT